LISTSLIALGMPAMAADLGARPYSKAPAAAIAVNNWTGFYIGAMGGYAEEATSGVGALNGGFVGGTAGYNWQTGNFVLGVEADAAWADVGATVVVGPVAISSDIHALGTVRGRVGYAFDQILIYGTGGYAWANNEIAITALGVTIADTQFHSGWTAGGGVEVKFAPNWSVKAEYLYRSFESETYFAAVPPGIPVAFDLHSIQVGVNYQF
jgi:outer membrane immunogenic protein